MLRTGRPSLSAILLATTLAAACSSDAKAPSPSHPPDPSPVAATEAWRAKHETDYRRDWVSIAGLFPLKPGANTAGSAAGNAIVLPASAPPRIGIYTLLDQRVRFEPAPGVTILRKDQPVTSPIDLRDDSTKDDDELTVGLLRLVVHITGETSALRVRDPNGPLARDFRGFTWFPIDLQYRVTGRFIKDPESRKLPVVNTFGDLDEYTTEGVVEFALQGRTLRLRPFTTRPSRFYFVFKDASAGQETYATARFVYADLAADGSVVLDFNQAYNPPCAFNPFTTCPIPLPENRLPIKVLAGEKAYPVHVPVRHGS